jgi:hypothetical protein
MYSMASHPVRPSPQADPGLLLDAMIASWDAGEDELMAEYKAIRGSFRAGKCRAKRGAGR